MTLGDIASKARKLTHTDRNSYLAADLLIDINIWYEKVVSAILESQDDTDFDDARNTTYPIVTTPMIAGQRDYAIPVTMAVLKIKRVDITYDGTNYFRATPFDVGAVTWGLGNTTNEDLNMIRQAPRYDLQYNSVFIYPLPTATDVSAGGKIRIQWERNINPFTISDYTVDPDDSTVIPGFDPDFHSMLAYGAAFEKALADNLPQLNTIINGAEGYGGLRDMEIRLRTAYGNKDLDTVLFLGPAYENYGDYGGIGPNGNTYR